jgi:hypothetical protein
MRIYERVPDCVNEAIPIRLSAAAIRIGAGALPAGSRTHLAHRVSRIYKPGDVRHRPLGAEARAARPPGLPPSRRHAACSHRPGYGDGDSSGTPAATGNRLVVSYDT